MCHDMTFAGMAGKVRPYGCGLSGLRTLTAVLGLLSVSARTAICATPVLCLRNPGISLEIRLVQVAGEDGWLRRLRKLG